MSLRLPSSYPGAGGGHLRTVVALYAGALLAASSAMSSGVVAGATTPTPSAGSGGDPSAPRERALALVGRMTLDEKIAQVHGAGFAFGTGFAGRVPGNPRLGIPDLYLADGPGGVGNGSTGVTQWPSATNAAATWDRDLLRRYGAATGAEQFAKGHNLVLAPTVNILRIPRWGRSFETYGEDPYLSGQTAAAMVEGIQSQHVIAAVKHFAVNNQEVLRDSVDVRVPPRALHEIYLPAFRAAVQDAGAGAVVCSYNRVGGTHACENADLLTRTLKDAWAFDGFVLSDWMATHSTVGSASAGLDLEMPDGIHFGDALREAVRSGQVPQERLDDMVVRILTAMIRVGLLDHPAPATPAQQVSTPAHQELARRLSEQGSVLLRNEGGVLPVDPRRVRSIAVIGDAADAGAQTVGGGSAVVNPSRPPVTPLAGITARAGSDVEVTYARGTLGIGALPSVPDTALTPREGTGAGLSTTYFTGPEQTSPTVGPVQNVGATPLPEGALSARWEGTLTVPRPGTYRFALAGGGGVFPTTGGGGLRVDGTTVVTLHPDAELVQDGLVELAAGPHRIRVDWTPPGNLIGEGPATIQLGWQPDAQSLIDEAVTAARRADVAVVVASDLTGEGMDRASLALPADQDRLISAVAAANPRTVVVLTTSGAVLMPWIRSVPGVVAAWYGGQEAGTALASLLFGDVNPSGRLPLTFPASDRQGPGQEPAEYPGDGAAVSYAEDLLVGYRWYDATRTTPLFPFGHGLSYTTFRYSDLRVRTHRDGTVGVGLTVTNTGRRAGAEVVQLYLEDPPATGEPPRRLAGHRKVTLRPGESVLVDLVLDRRVLSTWDPATREWRVAPGEYRVLVGGSSRELRLRGSVRL